VTTTAAGRPASATRLKADPHADPSVRRPSGVTAPLTTFTVATDEYRGGNGELELVLNQLHGCGDELLPAVENREFIRICDFRIAS